MLTTVFLSTLLSAALTGCGFKLRGDYFLSPQLQTLYLSSVDQHGELTRIVKEHLLLNNIKLVKKTFPNVPEIKILKDSLDRRTLSVFSNGQVAEYELIYSVNYELRIKNQDNQAFSFELTRDYQDDPNTALAKSRELSLMLSEMRAEAANKILRNMANIQLKEI